MYVKGTVIDGTDNIDIIKQLRKNIFGTDVICFDNYFDTDTEMFSDRMAAHVIITDTFDGEPVDVGCGSLYFDGAVFVMDGVGVLEKYRNMQYGDFIVRLLLDRAFVYNKDASVLCYCSGSSVGFFKHIGFQETDFRGDVALLKATRKDIISKCHSHKE